MNRENFVPRSVPTPLGNQYFGGLIFVIYLSRTPRNNFDVTMKRLNFEFFPRLFSFSFFTRTHPSFLKEITSDLELK